jgi:hypothetical protein
MSKERPMPIRGFALTTIVAALALVATTSEIMAQAPRPTSFSAPVVPTGTRGVVVGLPDDDPVPALARLAMASNQYTPCYEPPSPTKGLWAGCSADNRLPGWQECFRSARDGLGWVFCRPTCNCGMPPPSDASAWDWVTQWTPRLNSFSLTGTIGSTWDWLVQWLPHFGSDGTGGASTSPWDWLVQWLPRFGSDAPRDSSMSTWDWLMQWMPRLGSVSAGAPRMSQAL